MDFATYLKNYPDKDGRFGKYGGAYLPEKLIPAFNEITKAYSTICHSSDFINELRRIRKDIAKDFQDCLVIARFISSVRI